jgi:hypothetical protein
MSNTSLFNEGTNDSVVLNEGLLNATAGALSNVDAIQPYLEYGVHGIAILGSIVLIASLITAGTNTPDPATRLGKLYKVIEVLALVVGRAKDGADKRK